MYTILFIGKSDFKFKYLPIKSNLNVPDQTYKISRLNSANHYMSNEIFDIIIKNNICYVSRIDINSKWNIELKIYIKYIPKTDHNIILSITTLPERISSPFFKHVYEALLLQQIPFSKLIINLEDNFNYQLPTYLKDHDNIIWNKTSYTGPCCKIMGALDIVDNDTKLVILDDDIIFKPNWLISLLTIYNFYPNHVISNLPLEQRHGSIHFFEPRGFAGYIFNVNDTIKTAFKRAYEHMPTCAKFIDDTWAGYIFYKLNINVIPVTQFIVNNSFYDTIYIKETDTHPRWKELEKHTDRTKLTIEFLSQVS